MYTAQNDEERKEKKRKMPYSTLEMHPSDESEKEG
jgi:hypothetical protein